MKKILAMLIASGLMLACNSKKTDHDTHTEPSPAATHEHAAETTGLVLNNGAKWKADSSTLQNVALLQATVSGAKKETLDNYMQTATQLQDGLNKMVRECKMKGADHDALHQWLEPLMEKTKDLNKATSIENAAAILHEIEKQVGLFAQYFEK